MTNQFMCTGTICCYQGCDFDNIMLCCKGSGECLCLVNEHCCAANTDPFPIGMATEKANKEICKIGLFCCTCGLKTPEVLCSGASQLLCLTQAQSLPFNKAYVPEPVCACYCLQCLPELGCAKPPPACPALQKIAADATPANQVMGR